MDEEVESETIERKFDPKVRWVLPQSLDQISFVGKEVLALVHDVYIIFYNLKTRSEVVYSADNEEAGDGVDVVCGHRSYLFAFTEKVKHGKIFIGKYPSLKIIAELKDYDVNRYKGLCMMECDLIAGFSGFPNYLCSIWSWRTNQRLACVETGVIRRKQIFLASRLHMTVCQCWGDGLIVWEVGQCYKDCFLLRRGKEEVTGWDISEPPLVDVAWSQEGTLYAIDPKATLYSVASDGIYMVTKTEWTVPQNVHGHKKPSICAFGLGFLIYGPDKTVRSLKRIEENKSWSVVWEYKVATTVERMVGNATCDVAVMWTFPGQVYTLTGDTQEKIQVQLFNYKMRHIIKVQLLAPDYKHLVAINESGIMAIYEVATAKLVALRSIRGESISCQASPAEPLIAIFGEVRTANNFGLVLYTYKIQEPNEDDDVVEDGPSLKKVGRMCLTYQNVSHVYFSSSGRVIVAAAMSAGHIFLLKLDTDYKMTLIRYTEVGRGLADCLLMQVGDALRCFSLVLFSDKYAIGERVICINTETGKDNKFTGKMQGPYCRLLPSATKDTMIAIPHLSKQLHVLKLTGDKGVTVAVKIAAIYDTGHEIKQFDGFFNKNAFLTYGYDGKVIVRQPTVPENYEYKITVTHRYASASRGGITEALIDDQNTFIVQLNANKTVACVSLYDDDDDRQHELILEPPDEKLLETPQEEMIHIIYDLDKNYLDLQEENRIRGETMDYKAQRAEVVKNFELLQSKLVNLLDENFGEVPLHQLPMAEFNLHLEAKKERNKQAEKERELIRLTTEARIRAQDVVTAWIKEKCWDSMRLQRVKLYAIFSHYYVENFGILPTHRDKWPELIQIEALRDIQNEGPQPFKPWEEPEPEPEIKVGEEVQLALISTQGMTSPRRVSMAVDLDAEEMALLAKELADTPESSSYALSGSVAHLFVTIPRYTVPQTLAYSFLHMDWMQNITKVITQNVRIWFNKQFDEMMALKTREVGLVKERNNRLRFIVEELNKLSDLRGSFHHLIVKIVDPEWKQDEQPHRLIKVEPEECSIEPYISPSQIVIIPPDPGPKDDFRERALIEMMDGVLEKLWHEEIKKPIPLPQCMLDKDPEHFNEEDLRHVFDYEAKVKFRNEERDKYRKMLHSEYAKLSATLNEGIVRFNQKVKETWLLKVRIDAVIHQENMKLIRLRRTNLDRVEMAEQTEKFREEIALLETQLTVLNEELEKITLQNAECQSTYEALSVKDKSLEKAFKNHFTDLSPIIIEQCYKFFRKRPKWHQRASMTPSILYEMAHAALVGVRPPNLHHDCFDYLKALDLLDQISNMPAVMDEGLWHQMCKLRRVKIENEIRMRGVAQDTTYVENTFQIWSRAIHARKQALINLHAASVQHRLEVERIARNKTIQLVLPAGQIEITTTGHFEDYEDATLMPREEIVKINNIILRVGEMKLRMMRKQMEFRKGILSKEWEHARTRIKLRHMKQELYSYQRLKIPKELQKYLKDKEKGYTDEMDYVRLERAMEGKKKTLNQQLTTMIHKVENMEVKLAEVNARISKVNNFIVKLNVKVSEKRIYEDPLEPIRIRRIFKNRMETLVARAALVREVQANHSKIVELQTQLELLRLKTYPTLASYREV